MLGVEWDEVALASKFPSCHYSFDVMAAAYEEGQSWKVND